MAQDMLLLRLLRIGDEINEKMEYVTHGYDAYAHSHGIHRM